MANSSLYQYASKYAQKAYDQDQAGNYKSAFQNYLKAAEILQQLISFTSNPQLKNMYFLKSKEYLARAKELKDQGMQPADTGRKKRSPSKRSSKDSDESDEDKDELEDAIDEIIIVEKPNVKMSNVAGLEEAKRALREAIILPMKRPDLFKGARNPWKGILLFGPPGTGKTLLARAVATEVDATFFNVSASSIISKWLGESEKLVDQLFETAQERQPSLIFIDEIDSIASTRGGGGEHDAMRRVKTTLMTQMSGVTSKKEDRVVVIGATNLPWEIDPAFRSRFEKRIYINLPDLPARSKIFEIHSKGIEIEDTVDFQLIGEMSDGYSGRDIQLICREAVMMPVRELDVSGALDDPEIQARAVKTQDYMDAFEKIKPSVAPEELLRHRDWAEEFGST